MYVCTPLLFGRPNDANQLAPRLWERCMDVCMYGKYVCMYVCMYVPEDGGSDGDGLDIGDGCWAAEQSDVGRERRLQARLAYIHTYKHIYSCIHS